MPTRAPFGVDEWYHCYNRGVDKRVTFVSTADYVRFQTLLYTCNSTNAAHFGNLHGRTLAELSVNPVHQKDQLVSIGAYALMPNHFHLVLKEKTAGGISLFMQKLMTGYTMYFNIKRERTGSLFAGSFKSKHVATDRYFKHLIAYVHLNPAGLYSFSWKRGSAITQNVEMGLRSYRYSSLLDFIDHERPERVLLGTEVFDLYGRRPTLKQIVEQAREYYAEMNLDERTR